MVYERVLGELVGEIILNPAERIGPQALRPTVRAGLELLDASLHPDYIIRQTESLAFCDASLLHRSVELEIAGDAIEVGEKGWLPLLALPRPLEVPVDVYDANDNLLPRPRGSEVREVLGAALVHLLRELLMADPAWRVPPDETPDDQLLVSERHIAERTLAAAVTAICRSGPRSPHAAQRRVELDKRLGRRPGKGRRSAQLHHGEPDPLSIDDLEEVMATERRKGERREKALALGLVLGRVRQSAAFLEVLEFVYGKHVVVATVAPGDQDRLLRVQLPDIDASPGSRHRQDIRRRIRSLGPGDHNFTARLTVPVPGRIEQYRLQLTGSADGDPDAGLGLVAAVVTEPSPMAALIGELEECRALFRQAAGEVWRDPQDVVLTRRRLAVLVHAAAEGRTVVSRLRATAETCFSGTSDALVRWKLGEARPRYGGFPYEDARPRRLRQAADEATRLLERTEEQARCIDAALEALGPSALGGRVTCRLPVPLRRARAAARGLRGLTDAGIVALDRFRAWAGDLNVHVTCEDSPGATTARVLVTPPQTRPDAAPAGQVTLDVWAAVVDQGRRYGMTVFLIPIGMLLLLGGFGFLTFDDLRWLWDYPAGANAGRDGVLDRQADALTTVILLTPAFVAGLRWRAGSSSVMDWLRRVPRAQGYTAVTASAVCAMFVAAEMRENAGRDDVARVLWVFRVSVGLFVAWFLWAAVACWRRRSACWEPKGMERVVVGDRRPLHPRRRWSDGRRTFRHHRRDRLRRLFRTRHPNVSFDLTRGPLVSTTPPRPSRLPASASGTAAGRRGGR